MIGGLVVALGGCAELRSSSPNVTTEPASEPTLATARDAQFSMFGEFPDQRDATFVNRSGSALLRHTFTEEGADFDCHIDPWGRRMVFASTRHDLRPDLYIKTVDGTTVTQLTADAASDVQPEFSPDGQSVAFASDRAGNWDIWTIRVDGTQPTQVTRGPGDDVHPSWSSDGKWIVFSRLPRPGGQWEMWIADATAEAPTRFIGYGLFPQWSPTGDMIAFQRARQRGSRWFSVWTLELVDGEPRHPTEVAASFECAVISPSWRPDGTALTYCTVARAEPSDTPAADGAEATDVWMVDIDGRSRVRLTDGQSANYEPTWSPQGRIFFTSTRGGHENIWSLLPPSVVPRDDTKNKGIISQRGARREAVGADDS
jgi:TolB protein